MIEDGQDAWNNPYLIDDTDQGYYKTRVWGVSTHPMYGYPINGKVVYEKGADGSDNALIVKAEKGLTYKKGDILVAFAMPNSSVGLRLENKAEGFNSSSEYGLVAFYYKAKSSGTIGARVVSNDQIFSGVYHFSEDTTVKGSFFSAGQHAVRPLYQLKMSKIAFLRPTDSGVDVDISSTLGNLPTRFLFGDSSKKLVVKSEDVTIDATITAENVTSDRDTGRAKCTKVEGTTVKVPWASKTVTIDNVSTNNANYVSALVHTEDEKKYGVLAKSEEGKVTLELENLVNTTLLGSKATVSLYAEQASDANYSDSISAKPVTFQIEIAAVAPQTLVYDTDGGSGATPSSSFAGAGETVQLANGDELTKEGMSFSRWKLSYVPYGATEAVSLTYKSGENLVVPDTADGVISVKAVYAGIDLEKTTSSSSSVFTVTWYANSPATGVDTRVGTERKLNTKIDKVAGVGALTADNIPADAVNVTEGSKWGFAGWGLMPNVSPANAMSKEDLAGTIVTQNVQYYAIWELKSTINWDANGGYFGTTDKTTTQTLADPDEGTLIDASNMPTTSPKNSDTTKIFTGYNTLADGTGTSVYAGGPEVLAEEGSTFYATWTTIDTYWMAPSYANGKETEGIVKGPDTIQADVAILRNGATDSRYAQVKAEWDGFLNNNSYSLYTKWNGSTEDEAGEQALNGWAEFHLLEVATDKDGVGASMSFMSSYAIPYAMPAFSSSSYYGYSTDIWKNHLVCPKLQQGGEIFESYGARLRNDILTVTKSKVENKMWLMSVYDTNFTWWQNASNITDVTYIMYKTRAQNLPKGFDTSRIYSNMIWCFYLRDNFPNRNDSQKLNYYCGMGRYSQYYDYGLKWHYEIAEGPSQKYASILPCFCF